MRRTGVPSNMLVSAGIAAAVALPSMAHLVQVPSLMAGVLVPLMLPRVGATLRRVFAGERAHDIDDACACSPSRSGLARTNARLRRELSDLKAAHAALAFDLEKQAAAAKYLTHLAYHDALTNLPNRALLMDRLTQALANAQRSGASVFVIYLDLDGFKAINDTLGHASGDAVLCEIGRRIVGCLRTADTASRVGGDEFVLVCATTDAVGDAARIRSRLQRAIAAPIEIDGQSLSVSASLGMSVYPGDGSAAAELIERADQAMYFWKLRRAGSAGQAPKRRVLESRRYDEPGRSNEEAGRMTGRSS
jgi:diguanylate cyclase (GGDEF)-like protein